MEAPGYRDDKDAVIKRLRRIEGQVRGIAGMVEDDRYCVDVLDQVAAVTRQMLSWRAARRELLLDDHLGHCVAEAVAAGGEQRDAKLTEASAAIARLVRS